MLTPEQMSKVLIAGPKDALDPVIAELHRHRLFHIEDFVENDQEEYTGYRIGNSLEGAGDISKELLRLRSVTGAFSLRADDLDPKARIRRSELGAAIEKELPRIEDSDREPYEGDRAEDRGADPLRRFENRSLPASRVPDAYLLCRHHRKED